MLKLEINYNSVIIISWRIFGFFLEDRPDNRWGFGTISHTLNPCNYFIHPCKTDKSFVQVQTEKWQHDLPIASSNYSESPSPSPPPLPSRPLLCSLTWGMMTPFYTQQTWPNNSPLLFEPHTPTHWLDAC